MKWRLKKGFVLIEVLLATAIASFAICGILFMYIAATDLIKTSKNASIATSAAQGLIEEIRNTSFNCLIAPCCSGVPCPAKAGCDFCYNHLGFLVNGIPSGRGVVYFDNTKPDLLKITVSVSWRQPGRAIDSTVELVTQVANRY